MHSRRRTDGWHIDVLDTKTLDGDVLEARIRIRHPLGQDRELGLISTMRKERELVGVEVGRVNVDRGRDRAKEGDLSRVVAARGPSQKMVDGD